MKPFFIKKLRELEGCCWIGKKQLLLWAGADNVGVVLLPGNEIYFELRENVHGDRIVYFTDAKPKSDFVRRVDGAMKSFLAEPERLNGIDEEAVEWMERLTG